MGDLAELVTRLRAGETEAFAAIVSRFQDMAVGYAYALLRDLHLAEDAAQEAFLEAYLCLPKLREPAAFPGWFRRIVFKQCDRLKRGKHGMVESLPTGSQFEARAPSHAAPVVESEVKDRIWSAIDSLPEHEREAVLLFYIGGSTQQEVSEFLGASVTAIKQRLFSARARMREMLVDIAADSLRARRPSRDGAFAARLVELLAAARAGDGTRVRELLKQSPGLLSARDWLGNSALIMAANSGHQSVVDLLFQAGVKPDVHEAAAIGMTERVRELCASASGAVPIDHPSAEGFTPLALAAHYGHRDTTEWLLERGAKPDTVSLHPLGVTPLLAALFGRQFETARLLIERGADVNIKRGGKGWPRAGWTALHYAAGYSLLELIEPIIARGGELHARDDEGRTPLAVAIDAGAADAAQLLRNHGAKE